MVLIKWARARLFGSDLIEPLHFQLQSSQKQIIELASEFYQIFLLLNSIKFKFRGKGVMFMLFKLMFLLKILADDRDSNFISE